MPFVVLEQLSKSFAAPKRRVVEAVHAVSLGIESGQLLALVGPSGSGKTTLLRMIAGLETPSGGVIRIAGEDVTSRPPQAREVSMVFQEHGLYPYMSVYRNLAFGLILRKFPKPETDRRVRETAELLGLSALLDSPPQSISGGERQRVALGRALVVRPKVLLLDEPLSNLDAPLRAQMRREIAQLQKRVGITMIYVTHDQIEAMSLADQLAVIHQGCLQQVGEPREVYDGPANTFVASFIGTPAMNLVKGTLEQNGNRIRFRPEDGERDVPWQWSLGAVSGATTVPPCKKVVLGFRPEHLQLLEASAQQPADAAVLEAEVKGLEPLGWETHVHLQIDRVPFVARVPAFCPFKRGERVRVLLRLEAAHLFDAVSGERLRSR
jgi:ABC-type sugar transport system ATPase subunit